MKHLLLLSSLLLCLNFSIKAQWVTISDPAFVTVLGQYLTPAALNGNQIDTTSIEITNLTSFYCYYSGISNLDGIQYFDNLEVLGCYGNNLTALPQLPVTLTNLNCHLNDLTSLPSLPSNLEYLNCNQNQLTSLPFLPNSLISLDCGTNFISTITGLPPALSILKCNLTQISTLPPLPSSLTSLDCASTPLSVLPTFPASLTFINLSDAGQFTSLPPLPPGLQTLLCHGQSLITLPPLPGTLEVLNVNFNYTLTSLPPLPASLKVLSVEVNDLTSIPTLPDSMTTVNFSYNPVTCMPELKTITNLNFMSTQVQCLPNIGNVANSNPPIASLPLCGMFNPDNCDFYYNISGNVFADDTVNCILDPTESTSPNIKLMLYQSGSLLQQTYTNSFGNYSFDTQLGTYDYSVDTTNKPFFAGCPVGGTYNSILSAIDSLDFGMDFGLHCKPGFDIGAISMNIVSGTTPFFPGDTALVRLKAGDLSSLYNLSCSAGISGSIMIYFAGPVSYFGPYPGSLIPNAGANFIEYVIPDFGAVNIDSDIIFYMLTDTTAQTGQPVCFSVDVTPSSGDVVPGNNQLGHCFLVTNSIDPNFKEASPVEDISPDQEWITYTIHFQNTGTASAQHIVITDTLDGDLQEGTFEYLGSSHNAYVNVNGNVVNFSFPNINLPDSTSNEPESHGYVQYKVRPDAGLALGTTIENTAAIYFDFNPPVITNTTINTVVAPTGIGEVSALNVFVHPNPTNDILFISTSQTGKHNFNLYDLAGRNVMNGEFFGNEYVIDVSDLAAGLYFVKVELGQHSSLQKIVIK